MKIFGWTAARDGCEFYRVEMPLRMMRHLGHETEWGQIWRANDPQWANPQTLIGQRMGVMNTTKQWMALCASGMMRCIFEIDDDIWNVDASSAARGWHDIDMQRLVEANATVAHVVTTTTPRLAEILGDLNPNVHVIPNTIPQSLLNLGMRSKHKGVNVGWGGSATHAMDFADVAETLSRAVERHSWARLCITGPNYVGEGRHIEIRPVQPRVPWWWGTLADIDIGIAPLKAHPFNESKSFIKILEYAAYGIPCVASNVGPYRDNVIHGETGYLCDTPADWEYYLSLLIRDSSLREGMGMKAREWAKNYTIEKWARVWEEVYFNG